MLLPVMSRYFNVAARVVTLQKRCYQHVMSHYYNVLPACNATIFTFPPVTLRYYSDFPVVIQRCYKNVITTYCHATTTTLPTVVSRYYIGVITLQL